MKLFLSYVLALFTISFSAQVFSSTNINSTEQLSQFIANAMKNSTTPGGAVAIVNKQGLVWHKSLGLADVEANRKVTSDTIFRLGSVSKLYVSLAVMKLVEQNKLSLNDKIIDLAPEIEFENPWFAESPIRVVHLLEHTTGWDDLHLTEFVYSDENITLLDSLAFNPKSRVSRWRPGTRMAYSNSGSAVAAYIVQKLTNKPFEQYIDESFLQPMNMQSASFFKTDNFDKYGTKLYQQGQVQPYWHMIMRPAGSLNSTLSDFSHLIQMLLNRGYYAGREIITEKSIQTIETPKSSLAAQAGMELGYSLSLYPQNVDSPYFNLGHVGVVFGGRAQYVYFKEHGVGYAILLNEGNDKLLKTISDAVYSFIVKDFETPNLPNVVTLNNQHLNAEGYYLPISFRFEANKYLRQLMLLKKVSRNGSSLWFEDLIGKNKIDYYPISDSLFRQKNSSFSSLSIVNDPDAGFTLHTDQTSWGKISTLSLALYLGFSFMLFLVVSVALLSCLVWVPISVFKGGTSISYFAIKLSVLIASLAITLYFSVIVAGSIDFFNNFGNMTFFSLSAWISSIIFAISTLVACLYLYKAKRAEKPKSYYWQSVCVLTLTTVLIYLVNYGVIGRMSWIL